MHLAYIDQISDLPTSPIDVQDLVNSIGGTLEGDAGNDGYSSEIHGVISFAGGLPKMFEAGLYGKKNKKGFYKYNDKGKKTGVNEEVYQYFGNPPKTP